MDSSAKPTAQQSLRQKSSQHSSSSRHASHTPSNLRGSINSQPSNLIQPLIRSHQLSAFSEHVLHDVSHKQLSSTQLIRSQQLSSSEHVSYGVSHRRPNLSGQSSSSEHASYDVSHKQLSSTQLIRLSGQSSSSEHTSHDVSYKQLSSTQLIKSGQSSSSSEHASHGVSHRRPSLSGQSSSSEHASHKQLSSTQLIRLSGQSSSSEHASHDVSHKQLSSTQLIRLSGQSSSSFKHVSHDASHMPSSLMQLIKSRQWPSFDYTSSKPYLRKEVTGIQKLVLPNHLHRHALTLTAARAPYSCNGCKEAGFGRSYRCENIDCRYVLHEECANAVLQCKNPVSHSFFKEEKFWFLEKPLGYPRVCDACRMGVLGFVYHRYDNGLPDDTGLDLHPCCLKLRDNISYRDLDETKTLRLHRNVPKKCLKCKSRKVGDENKVKGWSYLTSDGDCYHVSCFKELFLEKVRDDYFSKKKIVVSKMQSNIVENNNMKVVKVGEGSNNSKGSSSSGAMKMVGKIAPVVLKLIFSAIFGDPVSFVLALVEALATSIN